MISKLICQKPAYFFICSNVYAEHLLSSFRNTLDVWLCLELNITCPDKLTYLSKSSPNFILLALWKRIFVTRPLILKSKSPNSAEIHLPYKTKWSPWSDKRAIGWQNRDLNVGSKTFQPLQLKTIFWINFLLTKNNFQKKYSLIKIRPLQNQNQNLTLACLLI